MSTPNEAESKTWCGRYLCCREKDHEGACEVDDTLLIWEDGISREL